jgi:hypothetical protein
LDFHTASLLRQLLAGGHVAPLGHIIHIPIQPVLHIHLNTACLVFKKKIHPTKRVRLLQRGHHDNDLVCSISWSIYNTRRVYTNVIRM